MQSKKRVFIVVILSLIASTICLYMYFMTDMVQLVCNGAGIDSAGVLYLGFNERIVKYQGEERTETIPVLFRAYAFEILPDDTIYCSDAVNSYIMDLNGKTIQVIEKTGSKEYNRILREKRIFTSVDGQEYEMRTPLGRRVIQTKEGKVIWKMPMRDYLIVIIGFLSIMTLMACVVIAIFHFHIEGDWSV